jgi:hypothetical protein
MKSTFRISGVVMSLALVFSLVPAATAGVVPAACLPPQRRCAIGRGSWQM